MVIKVSVPGQFQFKLLPTVRNLMFAGQSEVHYIGGSDILPSPLDTEDEAWYLERLMDNDMYDDDDDDEEPGEDSEPEK